MAYFQQDYLDFFQELGQNNSKAWFDENRKRYEASIKKPFKQFTLDLTEAVQDLYPDIDLADKFNIMRINRDIRFSADKTPYKDHMALMILPGGKKDKTTPGIFLQANHKDVRIYSGCHMLEKEQLLNVRTHIKDNLDRFNSLLDDENFKNTYSEILGDKHKRLPPELKEAGASQPLIFNKNFYWYAKFEPQLLLSDELIPKLVETYRKTLPMNAFFTEALG